MKKILWWGLLALLLAACGGDELATPAALPSDYTRATGKGVSLGLPPDWYSLPVNAEDFAALAEQLRAENPAMAAYIDDMASEIEADTLRFAAYSNDGRARVNIAAQQVPPFTSAENQAAGNRAGLENFGYTIVERDEVQVLGVDAQRTLARLELNTAQGRESLTLLQYTLIADGTAYSISFGAPSATFTTYQPVFEQILQTFSTENS